jgi:hypothetical protein
LVAHRADLVSPEEGCAGELPTFVGPSTERGRYRFKRRAAVMEYPIEFDYKTNALFKGAVDSHLNACVGGNGGPYDFAAYGRGFFDGAKLIVEAVKSGNPHVDILVYPAAFSYRHGIELYLKHLFQKLVELNRGDQPYDKTHGIERFWRDVRGELAKQPTLEIDKQIADATAIIGAFCEIDPSGQVFRYPEDIKGNPHLKELRLINLRVLGEGMERLLHYFVDWQYWIEARIEQRNDLEAEVRQR